MKKQDTEESATQGSDAAPPPGTGEMEGSTAAKDVTDTVSPNEPDRPSQIDGAESSVGEVSAIPNTAEAAALPAVPPLEEPAFIPVSTVADPVPVSTVADPVPVSTAAEGVSSQCDMAEELSRQLEDILNTYCLEDNGEDGVNLPNGQSHGPVLNGLANEKELDVKPEDVKVNACGAEKEKAKTQDKKKVKGLGKEITLLMQTLNTLSTPEEKLAGLCKKYADLLEEQRNSQKQMRVLQKKQSQLVQETDHLKKEHSKAILARSKLESLCRELQRHNRTLKEDGTQRARVEEEKRKVVTSHFQVTLNDIQAQMEQHNERNASLRLENSELAEKLKKLIQQYELREEHIDKVFKHKEKQQQLVDAKLQRTAELMRELEGKQQRERDFLLKDATEWRHECELLKEQETQLKQQLSLYMDKFEEFQTTLAKSNEVFTTFRQEMEKMTKKIKKLEKETTLWRTKWETNNQALLQMAEEKTLRDKHHKGLHGKLECLEKLCRALQKERDDLTTKLGDLQSTTEEGTEPLDPQPSQKSTQDEMSPPGRGEETQSLTTPELELESSTTEQLDN